MRMFALCVNICLRRVGTFDPSNGPATVANSLEVWNRFPAGRIPYEFRKSLEAFQPVSFESIFGHGYSSFGLLGLIIRNPSGRYFRF